MTVASDYLAVITKRYWSNHFIEIPDRGTRQVQTG